MSAVKPPQDHASLGTIIDAIREQDRGQGRVLVGIAGPPGGGKSTLATKIATRLGPDAAVLPMDGYHLDNATLVEMGLLDRKGAPDTFDSADFVQLVQSLRHKDNVSYATFDRDQDRTVPEGGKIQSNTRIVLIEGNYLLLQSPPWSELRSLFDLSVFLDVPKETLKSRLVRRWHAHGLTASEAEARAEQNDMKNVETVQTGSAHADFYTGENA